MRNARHPLDAMRASSVSPFVLISVVSLILSAPFAVNAETVVQCGTMEGYGYIYPSPFVQQDQAGFNDHQVSKNAFVISLEGEQYDVSRLSETGKRYSSLAEGGKIIPIANNKNHFVLLVGFADKTAEIYTYHKPSKTLTLLQHKYGALVTSSTLMVSQCE